MFIRDLFSHKTVLSLEVFPPKQEAGLETIIQMLEQVKDLAPDFISVTYGAGGGSRKHTVELASIIKNKYKIEALAHLTGVGSSKAEIAGLLRELQENNIENVLALRGDIVDSDTVAMAAQYDDFQYAKDLVEYIKTTGQFSIGAACYPEAHLECPSKADDLKHLKEKVASGVDFLITQLFFDNNFYFDFREKLELINVDVPVSAGIMPVINKKQIERITHLCGATLTPKFKRMLVKYENKPEALKEAGIAYATEQIIDLISYGVEGIHLYAMNRPEIAERIFSQIHNIRQAAANE